MSLDLELTLFKKAASAANIWCIACDVDLVVWYETAEQDGVGGRRYWTEDPGLNLSRAATLQSLREKDGVGALRRTTTPYTCVSCTLLLFAVIHSFDSVSQMLTASLTYEEQYFKSFSILGMSLFKEIQEKVLPPCSVCCVWRENIFE